MRPVPLPPWRTLSGPSGAGPAEHNLPRLVNLFGIESPGLTSLLSLAEAAVKQLA